LERALEEYPYSSILQVLYLKALKNQNNYLYPKQLKRAALAVPDRKVLHDWVEAEAVQKEPFEAAKPAISFHAEEKVAAPLKVVNEVARPLDEENSIQKQAPEPAEKAPEIQPVKLAPVVVPPIPVPLPNTKEPVKEDDLDLMNLPASVRETVLRARKIRQQYGNEVERVPKLEPLPKPTVAPVPLVVETPIEKVAEFIPPAEIQAQPSTAPLEELIKEAPPVADKIQLKAPEEEITAQREVAPDNFVLREEEAIEERAADPELGRPREKHSFLDWLETGMLEDDDRDDFVVVEELTDTVATLGITPEEEPNIEVEPAAEFVQKQDVESEEVSSTERVQELYQSFIEKPRLHFRAPTPDDEINLASLDTSGKSDYITETLAQVYVSQKLYNRAINAYEILRLKYPEKSSFFATRILEIKEFLNDKK
jgi:hypothetical protein